MAERMSLQEARQYGVHKVDLITLISNEVPADWRMPESVHDVSVSQAAYVPAMGQMRRGAIVKITKTKVYVAFTTQGSVDEAARYGCSVRIQITAETPDRIRVAPLPTLEQDIERVTAGQIDNVTVTESLSTPAELALQAEVDALAERAEATIEATDETLAAGQELLDELEAEADEANTAPATGSTVVAMLEQVWTAIQANHPELPDVVIVTGSGMIQKSARWGHHRPNGWNHKDQQVHADGVTTNLTTGEMFIAGETLAKGAAFTVETMLHEAAHALARVRDLQDTSRQNRWHNATFRKLSEELGLEYALDKAHPQYGYSDVTLTPGTAEEYAELIAELDAAIRLTVALPMFLQGTAGQGQGGRSGGEYVHGGGRKRGEATNSNTNNLKLTCLCSEPNIIRASRKVADKMVISCDDCDSYFKVREG